jgi:hypothetical protein
MPSPTGFSFRELKDGSVIILHQGRVATTLRKRDAVDFLDEVSSSDTSATQELMARLTGNYKHGNENQAKAHFRNRAAD